MIVVLWGFKSNGTSRCVLKNLQNIRFLKGNQSLKLQGEAHLLPSTPCWIFVFHGEEGKTIWITCDYIWKHLGVVGFKFYKSWPTSYCRPLLLLFLCHLVGYPSCTLLRSSCMLMHNGICTPTTHPEPPKTIIWALWLGPPLSLLFSLLQTRGQGCTRSSTTKLVFDGVLTTSKLLI